MTSEDISKSTTQSIHTGCGELILTTAIKDGHLFKIFIKLGKTGSCSSVLLEAVANSIVLGLRFCPMEKKQEFLNLLLKKLAGGCCEKRSIGKKGTIYSCVDGVVKLLKELTKKEAV